MTLEVGQKAPSFNLADQNGDMHKLEDYKGQWVVLYFYPKDDTPGCTKEACAMRDNLPSFEKIQAKVFGISTDSVESHKKFENKHELNFTLLADPEKEMVEKYEVYGLKKFMGREYMGTKRMTFIVNPEGEIAKIYKTVKPAQHAEQVLNDIQTMQTA